MRAERRQELKSNELAAQIDQVKAFAREHRTSIVAVIAGAIVVFGGATLITNNMETKRVDGWTRFQSVSAAAGVGAEPPDAGTRVDGYTRLADEEIEPALTLAAWLAVGDVAREQLLNPAITGTSESRDWHKISEGAYQKVLSDFPDSAPAVGAAMMALGTLAEDNADVAAARKWYNSVIEDARLKDTPFVSQAEFRLEHVEEWTVPVVFAPPIVGPMAPDDATGLSPDFSRLPPGIRPPSMSTSGGPVPVDLESDGVKIERVEQSPLPINKITPAGDSSEPTPSDTRAKSSADAEVPAGAGDADKDAKKVDPPADAADAGASQGGGTP